MILFLCFWYCVTQYAVSTFFCVACISGDETSTLNSKTCNAKL